MSAEHDRVDLPLTPAPVGDGCCGPEAVRTPDPGRRAVLTRRVRLLVAATITYNVIEAVVALTAGTIAPPPP